MVKSATIAMNLSDRTFGVNSKVKSVKRSKVSERLTPAVPLKHSEIDNSYNSMTVSFNGGYEVEFRVFDNGVAHRFITTGKQPRIEVDGERFSVAFPSDMKIHLQQPGGFKTAYEEVYSHKNMSEWGYDDRMSTLPVLVEASDSLCVLVSESDLSDYPCMFLRGNGANGFTSVFPKVPLEFGEDGDRSLKILKEADYIAETAGSRTFPWRYMAIGTPKEILEQTLTCQLASPSVIGEAGWVASGFCMLGVVERRHPLLAMMWISRRDVTLRPTNITSISPRATAFHTSLWMKGGLRAPAILIPLIPM